MEEGKRDRKVERKTKRRREMYERERSCRKQDEERWERKEIKKNID